MTTDRFLAAYEESDVPHLDKGPVLDLRNDASRAFGRVAGEIDGLTGGAHTHANKATLDAIQQALTTALKSNYDSAYSAMHSHSNKTVLDNTQEAFTTALKSTYDGYAAGKENAGAAAAAVAAHELAYDHTDFLSKNGITAGPYTSISSITVADGQITAITGS